MAEPKPFASLTSGLLARKGGARPAMRPQSMDKPGNGGWDDLGWNDMGDLPGEPEASGHRTPSSITGLTPAPTPQSAQGPSVIEQQRAIEERFAAPQVADEPEEEIFLEEAAAQEPVFEEAAFDAEEAAVFGGFEADGEDQPEAVQQDEPVAIWPAAEAVEAPGYQPRPDLGRSKAAFTLRLDEGRHLKLRLACAVQNRSAQRIVCGALDAYLDSLPELDSLAQHVPARREKRL